MREFLMVWLLLLLPLGAWAGDFSLELNANDTVAEARLGRQWNSGSVYNVNTQVNLINHTDDYLLGSLDLSWRNTVMYTGLSLDMGFKGLWGQVEQSGEKDPDAGAVGFLIGAAYQFPESRWGIPLEAALGFCLAPDPLCFQDSDGYTEFRTSLGFHVLDQQRGTIQLGFRRFSLSFDDSVRETEKSDNALFLGYRFRF